MRPVSSWQAIRLATGLLVAVGAEFFQQPPMGDRLAPALLRNHRHFLALDVVAAERRVDDARLPVRRAPDQRQIFAGQRQLAAMIGEKL